MRIHGPAARGFNFDRRRIIAVTNTHLVRASIVDVCRAGGSMRRFEVDAGATIELEVDPGEVEITFGHNTTAEVLE